eukprot:1158768-Pelagomonas_calceolata.AAC.1
MCRELLTNYGQFEYFAHKQSKQWNTVNLLDKAIKTTQAKPGHDPGYKESGQRSRNVQRNHLKRGQLSQKPKRHCPIPVHCKSSLQCDDASINRIDNMLKSIGAHLYTTKTHPPLKAPSIADAGPGYLLCCCPKKMKARSMGCAIADPCSSLQHFIRQKL